MKRLQALLLLACLLPLAAWAVPARPGLWKTIVTADGRQQCVQLCGDEHGCWWQTADGRCYSQTGQALSRQPLPTGLRREAGTLYPRGGNTASRPSGRLGERQHRQGTQPIGHFEGHRKGLIILAEFQNKQFAEGHDSAYYVRVANERGFSEGDYRGSVSDYFLSQSGDRFELDFDVVGPVTVSRNYEYYGQPGTADVDAHPWEMVVEACELAAPQVDFADYDWDGDGRVEQVFVLYAGQGQSDSYDPNTIWPHEYELSQVTENGVHIYGEGVITPGGQLIDTYACSNELTSRNTPSGIGTICHEFSHCMGLPDLYDVYYTGNFGMGHWDIMALGVYNGAAFCPAAYTSYERMVCGWLQPTELAADTVVSALQPLAGGGGACIVYNQGHPDEYYLLENRQQEGWDEALPASGLLVLHVDYDERVWRENIVNATVDYRSAQEPDLWNTHQRLTLVHADNDNDKRYWRASGQYYTQTTEETDAYPYRWWREETQEWMVNDSLTTNSVPAATVWHANADGSQYLGRGVQQIQQHADGTVSFRFQATSEKYVAVDTTLTDKPDLTGAVFYESFDQCLGTGGNDGVFKGNSDVASAAFMPDNGGWDAMVMGGGARCAKFGSAAYDGIVTTPPILLTGDSLELCFKAAPWSRDDTSLLLTATGDAHLATESLQMAEGQWTTFTVGLTGQGLTQITFTPGRRFFLDEVVVRPAKGTPAGISHPSPSTLHPSHSTFTLQGLPARNAHGLLLERQGQGFRKVVR